MHKSHSRTELLKTRETVWRGGKVDSDGLFQISPAARVKYRGRCNTSRRLREEDRERADERNVL